MQNGGSGAIPHASILRSCELCIPSRSDTYVVYSGLQRIAACLDTISRQTEGVFAEQCVTIKCRLVLFCNLMLRESAFLKTLESWQSFCHVGISEQLT